MTSLVSDCLAIVAAICLNEDSRAEIVSNSLWGGANIEVAGAKIRSIVRADAHVYPDRRRLVRLCVGRDCLHYHVYCEQQAELSFCRLSYAEPGDPFSRRIEIRAADDASMQAL